MMVEWPDRTGCPLCRRHTFTVTKETLLGIYKHSVNFRVWNNRDRFGTKAKYDKPKAFRLPNEDRYTSLSDGAAGSGGGAQCCEDGAGGSRRPRKLSSVLHGVQPKGKGKAAGKQRQKLNQSSESEGEGEYACVDLGVPDTLDEEDGKEEKGGNAADTTENTVDARFSENLPSSQANRTTSTPRKMTKADQQALLEEEQIRQYGLTNLSLCWSNVFGKRPSAVARSSVGRRNLQGMVVTMELRTPLMPEEWRKELCPMSITLCSAHNMPSSPVPHQELRHRCVVCVCVCVCVRVCVCAHVCVCVCVCTNDFLHSHTDVSLPMPASNLSTSLSFRPADSLKVPPSAGTRPVCSS